ncbi:hypothetical protein PG997_006303 [Apiospora hydei]|uniref:NADH:ubiquinone oxidoreductase intermediate-associated protein 30 domain-containing protein n=1 Tax=Apiospora hydei TaxID=1337664 RepID=A0ABR1WNH3_9PEZI
MTTDENRLFLFGGDVPWSAEAWTASDDRVRGGKSQSYLDCPAGAGKAVFRGTLDITALGGAGFASQRTVDRAQHPSWDVSAYDGLRLKVLKEGGDGKKYTLTLKDEVLPKRPDDREQSTVSWEYDFVSPRATATKKIGSCRSILLAPFLKPHLLRRRPITMDEAARLILHYSFFGKQEGAFRLEVAYIAAVKDTSDNAARPASAVSSSSSAGYPEKGSGDGGRTEPKSWLTWMCGLFK